MLAISVVADSASHLPLLRAALDAAGLRYRLTVLDTDLGSLCHFRSATAPPDFVFVNGELPFCETPEFVKDLLKLPMLVRTSIVVMAPLPEDLPSLAALGVSTIARKPIQADDLKALLAGRKQA